MVILDVDATFLRILLFDSCYGRRHSTRTNLQRPTEHLLVSKNHSFDKEKKSLTESPILKTHSIRGDSDKTALSRNSRRKVGNDQETKQQNCHITVYHSEL